MVLEDEVDVPPRHGGHGRSADRLATVVDVEMSEATPALSGSDQDRRVPKAWVLVRLFGEPADLLVLDVPKSGLEPAQLFDQVLRETGSRLDALLTQYRLDRSSLTPIGLGARYEPSRALAIAARGQAAATGPSVTVAVCTRDRPKHLARSLECLARQGYPHYDVVVVDNAPTTDEAARVVSRYASRLRVRRVIEPRPGLSRAKNRAIREATGEFVAFIDDDETADSAWLEEIARALQQNPEADAVSGLIIPAELDTQAQLWFEQFGGHSKGRGCEPAVLTSRTVHSPLYPLPPFGAGGNAAVRRSSLERLGGFDEALGAGTLSRGAEDTLMFSQLLLSGATVVYWPSAFVRHLHYREYDGLRKQMSGYGRGLTAFYTALIARDPRVVVALVKLAPRALRDVGVQATDRTRDLGSPFPADLLRAERRGMLVGPPAYLWQRYRNRCQRAS
ncbi:MAG: glycosyltransferase family 2 protein [Dehalococcoidia bacterium]